MTSKRNCIDIEKKLEIINALDSGENSSTIIKKFGLRNRATLSRIKMNRDKILSSSQRMGFRGSSKYVRKSNFPELEEALLNWFKEKRSLNSEISGSMIKEKAFALASELGIQNFKASNGFLNRFLKRHSIKSRKYCAESDVSVDDGTVREWLNALKKKISNYDEKNIFSADETALYWKMSPHKSYESKSKDIDHIKDRVSLLLIGNIDGSEREISLIGHSPNPREFQNYQVPMRYYYNDKALMTYEIFETEMIILNKRMAKQNRKVVVFLDDYIVHHINYQFSNIEFCYFPPDITSNLQPFNQGIIHCFKAFYRRSMIRHILALSDLSCDLYPENINLAKASSMMRSAWDSIPSTIFQNCFRKAGFGSCTNLTTIDIDYDIDEIWQFLKDGFDTMYDNFDEYVECDKDVPSKWTLPEEQIINKILNDKYSDSDVEDNGDEQSKISLSSVMDSVNIISQFLFDNNTPSNILFNFTSLENYLISLKIAKMKEATINSYFEPIVSLKVGSK